MIKSLGCSYTLNLQMDHIGPLILVILLLVILSSFSLSNVDLLENVLPVT